MKFNLPLIEGTLIERTKKFSALVKLKSGEKVEVRIFNSSQLTGCMEPKSKVLLSYEKKKSSNKGIYILEIVYINKIPIAIDSSRSISLVAQAIIEKKIPHLLGYASIKRAKRPTNHSSRYIDLVLTGNSLRTCYVKVIHITSCINQTAYFPDGDALKYVESLNEMTKFMRTGNRVMLIFIVLRPHLKELKLLEYNDSNFTQTFYDTCARGLEKICYSSKINRKGISLGPELQIIKDKK